MSDVYRRLCLSHKPVLELEECDSAIPPEQPEDHPNCVIGVARYSYPIVQIWLPTKYYDRLGHHPSRWYDVSWMTANPDLVALIMREATHDR